MNNLDKFNAAVKTLDDKYENYTEIDNRVDEIIVTWEVDDYLICINNNFIREDASHGIKDGLTFGKLYKIISIPEIDMIIIENDLKEIVPYFTWRFYKYNSVFVN